MIKELLVYPDERIRNLCADVRSFDADLIQLLEDMKDTMESNSVQALAAIQIAVPATVVVYKEDDGTFLELINPSILSTSGTQEVVETTLYMPTFSTAITRYDMIKLIYQDREGKQCSLDVDGKKSALIQRKIDYTSGGTLLDKMDKKSRKQAEKFMKKWHKSQR